MHGFYFNFDELYSQRRYWYEFDGMHKGHQFNTEQEDLTRYGEDTAS